MLNAALVKHRREFLRALRNHQYEETEGGILFPKQHAVVRGVYRHGVNGSDWREDRNLVPTEGLNSILGVAFHADTQITAWYLALSSANVSPAATWTGANYAANATEITSGSEGYSDTTRVAFTPGAASSGSLDNTSSLAAFHIVTASTLNVWGTAMISVSTKGATTGTLASAVKFSAVRSLSNGDLFNIGYTLSLTST